MTSTTVYASDFLNEILGSDLIQRAAVFTHKKWYRQKEEDRLNPNRPFLGVPPTGPSGKLTRVRDHSRRELIELLALHGKLDVNLKDREHEVVYDPNFVAFDGLPAAVQAEKILPMQTLCYALGEFILPPKASLTDLLPVLLNLIGGTSPEHALTINRLDHTARMSARLMKGERGYGPDAKVGFLLYSSLVTDTPRLDAGRLLPAAETLLILVNTELHNG